MSLQLKETLELFYIQHCFLHILFDIMSGYLVVDETIIEWQMNQFWEVD